MLRSRHLDHCQSTHLRLMIPKLRLPILDAVVVPRFCAGAPHLIFRPANWTDHQFHNQVDAMSMLPPEMLLRLPNAMTPAVDIWAFSCTESSCCFSFCRVSSTLSYCLRFFNCLWASGYSSAKKANLQPLKDPFVLYDAVHPA